ncbi:MAG: DUF4330 domain-containing protein [Tissierellia bacterium]|nr:DUF4330 domain-containing protein [Tissierellia bacterium]
MKLFDNEGRIFGKLSIIDLIAILVLVLLVFFAFLKISNKNLEDLKAGQGDTVQVQWTLYIEKGQGLTDNVKPGDILSGQKSTFDAQVVDKWVEPLVEKNLNQEGDLVESVHPQKEVTYVVCQGNLPHEDQSIKLGNQEIRYGQDLFLESTNYRIAGTVIDIEVDQ